MFDRPLIPAVLAFTGGILIGHRALSSCQALILPIFVSASFCLLAIILLSTRLRIFLLLISFFLAGTLFVMEGGRPHRISSFATQHTKATIDGTVLEPARIFKGIARLKVRADALFLHGKCISVSDNLLVTIYDHIPPLIPGERIRFPARLRPFQNFNNPGRYDYEFAMKLKGLCCAASVSDGRYVVPMGQGYLPFFQGLLERVQRPVRDFFKKELTPRDCALYRALILGERQGISDNLRESFNRTGLGHILAVSGLHIGLVAWVTFFLFKGILSRSYALSLRTEVQKLAALLTCLPVVAYTFLAGFHVSSQRAMIMVLVFLWSLILRQEKEVWSTLALAGLIILGLGPLAIYTLSFQLSFLAVIGILWLTPALMKAFPLHNTKKQDRPVILNRACFYIWGLVAGTLSAMIFLLPIISYYFHRISIVGIPATITVTPILGIWVIPLGLVSAATLPFSHPAAGFFLRLGSWGVDRMMELIQYWAHFSWSSLWMITPNSYEILMFYTFIFFIFLLKRWRWAKLGLLILAVLVLADAGYWAHRVLFNKYLKVTFLDVGQGNAALVEFPKGKKMLIDGGGFPRDYFDVGKMVVAPCLWHSKIWRIDYLVLSHPQADHMNGLRFIARTFHPKEFWYNGDRVKTRSFRELMAITEKKGIKRLPPKILVLGRQFNGAKVEVLHPVPDTRSRDVFDSSSSLNNNSLVVKISYAGRSILFPGDIEQPAEEELVSRVGEELESDVLLSPHHGSRSSSSKSFLLMVRPRICVISSGAGNFFGFPHEQTLRRLRDIGCRIIKIQESGAVQFTIGPKHFEFRTFLEDNGSN